MIGLVLLLGLCGIAIWVFVFLLFCVFGIVLTVTGIKKVIKGRSSDVPETRKQKVPPVLYIIAGVILTAVSFPILLPVLDCFRGNGYDFLNKSLELLMIGFKLLFVFSLFVPLITVVFLVIGIRMRRKLKSIDDVGTYNKRSKSSVLLISLGVSGIVVSLISLLMLINLLLESNNSNVYSAYDMSSRFSGLVEFGIFVICVFAFTVWAWVKGIRTARKLKSIDDVDTYNKNLKLSVLLFFLGMAGICASIFMVQMFIHGLNNILTIISLYKEGRLV